MTGLPIAAVLLASVVLAAVHAAAPAMRFLQGTPRSIWLSIAGGVSVAYVFVHLLPELAEGQRHISRALGAAESSVLAGVPGITFAERRRLLDPHGVVRRVQRAHRVPAAPP
ncbi:MAG TPA: hypothetical protein VGE02_09050 [Gemmatimonadales bacterium]